MGFIERITDFYNNSVFSQATFEVPALETTILFAVLTFCLLLRFARTGLVIAYIFVYRWGWIFCREEMKFDDRFFAAYIVFGVLVCTFVVVGMLHSSHTSAE